jgi:hypothetical protein
MNDIAKARIGYQIEEKFATAGKLKEIGNAFAV